MNRLPFTTQPKVAEVFARYPVSVRKKIEQLRRLILDTAQETEGVTQLEESLKWGEPSYRAPKGSPSRIDWKEKSPQQYAMYVQCTSKLVPTFRKVYEDTFTFEGNRALVFGLEEALPVAELKRCIAACLTYHQVKHLPLLGL